MITTLIARQYSKERIRDDKERVRCYRGDKREEIIERRLLDDGLQDCTISRKSKGERRTTTTTLLSTNKKKKNKNKTKCQDQQEIRWTRLSE
jgi:hypothetical protein